MKILFFISIFIFFNFVFTQKEFLKIKGIGFHDPPFLVYDNATNSFSGFIKDVFEVIFKYSDFIVSYSIANSPIQNSNGVISQLGNSTYGYDLCFSAL
jgi:hypothetical protein